jgi:hypothetical protein
MGNTCYFANEVRDKDLEKFIFYGQSGLIQGKFCYRNKF